MVTTRISTKGQIVVPRALRDALAWTAGLTLELVKQGDAVLLRPVRPFAATRLDEVAGCTAYQGPARSLEEMEAAIAQGARGVEP